MRRCLLLLFTLIGLSAKASFDFNANCVKAYNEIFALKINNARYLIDTEKKRNPQNAIPYLLDNYADYFSILTTESKSEFEKLKNNKSSRLNRIEKDDRNSPYYLFAQAEIHLQWALLNGYFQEYFASSMELKKAYSLLQDNNRKFPSFLPNQKNLGMLHAVLGALPPGLKRTVSVLGMKGNTQQGVKILENLIRTLPKSEFAHFYDDAVFCFAYVQTDILHNHSAYSQIISYAQKIDTPSLLKTYIMGYSAMRTAHNDDAIAVLNSRPRGSEYQYFGHLDYLNGVARMRKLDTNARTYFQNYINNYKGINYIKDAYLNLAWLELLKGNSEGYKDYISLVKSKGNASHEKDKQAMKEASDPVPHVELLRARLLFDGGYYENALNELKDRKAGDFKVLRDKVEFCYRIGRIYDESGKDDQAIRFYQYAIDLGRNQRYYFASNAAYRIGYIYEKKKDSAKAKIYYNTAIDMQDHDYERSIEAQAKDGLNRLKN